jgi:hypothetical protein
MAFRMINGISYDLSIQMPDGGQIVLADWGVQPLWNTQTVRAFRNHNIFRLDQAGNVIWQVRRDEGEAWAAWTKFRERAEALNEDDIWARSPFTTLSLKFADGTTNMDPLTYQYPAQTEWVEGAEIWCGTYDSRSYVLDPETGLAVCKTPAGIRPW